jgi:hypothetical protein
MRSFPYSRAVDRQLAPAVQRALHQLAKGSPLDNLAGTNVTDLRGFVSVRKRRRAETPNTVSRT